MPDETAISELIELDATRLDGVHSPANGTPFLLIKSTSDGDTPDYDGDGSGDSDDEETEDKLESHAGGKLSDKAKEAFARNARRVKAKARKDEADEIEDELTKGDYCGDPECEACVKGERVPLKVRTTLASGIEKGKLKAADRKKMPKSSFAYVDSDGGKHLPVHDAPHVRAALGRFNQTDFESDDAKSKAAGKIKSAASAHGVDVSDDSDVAQAAKGAIQGALNGCDTPKEAGHLATGQSGHMQPATAGAKDRTPMLSASPTSTGETLDRLEGGESAYMLPAEASADLTKAAATLTEALEEIERARQAAKDGGYIDEGGPVQTAVEKAYRRLRASDEKALRDAHSALSNVLAEHDAKRVAEPSQPSEEEDIMSAVTKEELVEAISAGVREGIKADRKARKAKQQEKAEKNANNNGDITAQQLKDGEGGQHDSDDISSVGGSVDPKFVNKESDEALDAIKDQLKAVTDTLGSLGETVQKMAKRPRQGGPVLDGQARGSYPAAEHRLSQGGDQDETTTLIKSLEERIEKTSDPSELDRLNYDASLLRLRQAHERGEI